MSIGPIPLFPDSMRYISILQYLMQKSTDEVIEFQKIRHFETIVEIQFTEHSFHVKSWWNSIDSASFF